MYGSDLHDILTKALESVKWIRSTADEDDFRQVLCSTLYNDINPSNVEIPSTRSGEGDIKIFGRKIEIKFATAEKTVGLDGILDDFKDLISDKVHFCVVACRLRTDSKAKFIHTVFPSPMLAKDADSADTLRKLDVGGVKYAGSSIFLPASYFHKVRVIDQKLGKGKNPTGYQSFETAPAIEKSSFLQIGTHVVHVNVVGTPEDGFLAYLFKNCVDVHFEDIEGEIESTLEVETEKGKFPVARMRYVRAVSKSRKGRNVFLEKVTPLFTLA